MSGKKSGRKNQGHHIPAALAGVLSMALAALLGGLGVAHAMRTGTMTLVNDRGHRMNLPAAEQEIPEEAEENAEASAPPGFTEEDMALLNENPAETEAEIEQPAEPEEPEVQAVFMDVEPVDELVLEESIHINPRTQTDPFFTMGLGTDDVITWTGTLPVSYNGDEREEGDIITPVRNQGGSKLCWIYAAMGAIEANLLVKHPTLGVDHLDLSEKHAAYYVMNPATGSVGGLIDDDYRVIESIDETADQKFFNTGLSYIMVTGFTDYLFGVFSAWKGPVDEDGPDTFKREKNNKITIADQGQPSGPYGGSYHVQGMYEIPAGEYNRDAVKKMILNWGAVTASIHGDKTKGNTYWYLSNLYDGDPYGENNNLADHEVLVVGWDDEYETDNFRPEPAHPGAWYCRNSWGPTSGENGYFWLSYDDVIFNNNNVVAYNVSLRGDDDFYDNNYQVASVLTHAVDTCVDQNNVVYALSEAANPYGVIYTAQGSETLKAVSLFLMETENEYEISVFLDPVTEGDGSITAANLMAPAYTKTYYSASGGYHTLALDEPISLTAGQKFLVVIKPTAGSRLIYEKAMTSTGDGNMDEDGYYVGNIRTQTTASGLSLYPNADGSALVPQGDRDFFIKAFTNSN